ncbi:MAG: hypothetical protein PSX71_04780 [bacterium]|nr:hypothetical protein [bacterium]
MSYVIAWSLYVLMAALLVFGFERYVAGRIGSRQWRIFLRATLVIVLFTPGFVATDDMVYVVPACVGVMFNILAKSGTGLLKAALPLLLVFTLVFGVLFFRESRRDGTHNRF